MKRAGITAWARGFGLVLLSCAATAAWAQGTIVFVTPPQPINYAGGFGEGSYNLDLDGNGTTDLVLGFDLIKAYLTPQSGNSIIIIRTQTDVGPATDAAPLNGGDSISANPSSLDPVLAWYDPQLDTSGLALLGGQAVFDGQLVYSGYWSGVDGFVGLRFLIGGETHYGWMEINNYSGVAAGQLLGWAYDTRPDMPILAGAVPEPTTFALLLVSGAAFWLVRKRC
jgi:hypothetical protein